MVQQILERMLAMLPHASPSGIIRANDRAHKRTERYDDFGFKSKEKKVAKLEKFSSKKGGEVYRWFAQLRLVLWGKPQAYFYDEDKVAYVLSYMIGARGSVELGHANPSSLG